MAANKSTVGDLVKRQEQTRVTVRFSCGPAFYHLIEVMSDEDYPTKRADAEFIVRACNAHDDLVKALNDVLAWAGKDKRYLKRIGLDFTTQNQSLNRAFTALAKAEATPCTTPS